MVIISNEFYKVSTFVLFVIIVVFFTTSFIKDLSMNDMNPGDSITQLSETGDKVIVEYDNITTNTISKIENSSGIAQTLTLIPGIVTDSMKLLKNMILLVKDYTIILFTNLGVPKIILTVIGILLVLFTIVLFIRAIGGNI